MKAPLLPLELSDTIIDLVHEFPDNDTRSKTLSSLAHASCQFRHRVNHHRYAVVNICSQRDVQGTRNLLESDAVWKEEGEQVKAFIKEFEVVLVDTEANLDVVLNKESAAFEFILCNIFQSWERRPNMRRSFTWMVKFLCADRTQQIFDWASMSDTLQSALRKSLQKAHLHGLSIVSMCNVPRDILHGSYIYQLCLKRLTFAASSSPASPSPEGILDPRFLRHGRAFAPDHSTSLLDYIGADAYNIDTSAPIFPKLRKLACHIDNTGEFEMTAALMQRAKGVRHFDISLKEPIQLPRALPYNHFTNLKFLYVTYECALHPYASDSYELMHKIISPFLPALPPIRHLMLSLAVLLTNSPDTNFDKVFEGHDFSPIDDFLSHSPPHELESIEIQLEVMAVNMCGSKRKDLFKGQFMSAEGHESMRAFLMSLFPRLAKLGIPVLKMTPRACVYDYRNDTSTRLS